MSPDSQATAARTASRRSHDAPEEVCMAPQTYFKLSPARITTQHP